MENTSRQFGYVTPVEVPPYEETLQAALVAFVAGVTGLDESVILPRWSIDAPAGQDPSVDSCLVGVTDIAEGDCTSIRHLGTDLGDPEDGVDTMTLQEGITVFVSFYGPRALFYAACLKAGCQLPQNLDSLLADGMQVASVGRLTAVAVDEERPWLRRVDMSVQLKRAVRFVYNIRHIASVSFNYLKD